MFTNAIQCLSEEDRGLEPIGHFLPILKRGIAVHHSGLLPLLKELVELLFQEGLIKVRSAARWLPVLARLKSLQGECSGVLSTSPVVSSSPVSVLVLRASAPMERSAA